MALILPLLLALLLGIIEFGVAVLRYNTLSNAAREGARIGIIRENPDGAIEARVSELVEAGTMDSGDVAVNISDRSSGATAVTVTVAYSHTLITGGFLQTFGLSPTIPLTATSSMIIE